MRNRGFTLIEVLVALMVVALGLAALLTAVSSAARTSGALRDKMLAEWIALNRITEVRLTVNRIASANDTGQLEFANRTWHYDTRYFDTSMPTVKRISVRVFAGDSKSTGAPVAEALGFIGTALSQPGGSNIDWTQVGSNPGPGLPPGTLGTPGVTPNGPGAATPPGAGPGIGPGTGIGPGAGNGNPPGTSP
jgi:general secretion pathway protein I